MALHAELLGPDQRPDPVEADEADMDA